MCHCIMTMIFWTPFPIGNRGGFNDYSHNILNPFYNSNDNQRGGSIYQDVIFWTPSPVGIGKRRGLIYHGHDILNPLSPIANENQRGVQYIAAMIYWTLGSIFFRRVQYFAAIYRTWGSIYRIMFETQVQEIAVSKHQMIPVLEINNIFYFWFLRLILVWKIIEID